MKSHIKKIILRSLKELICLLPVKPATVIIEKLEAIRPSLVPQLLLKLPRHTIDAKAKNFCGFYSILTDDEFAGFEYRIIDPETVESVPLPYVFGLSEGGSYSIIKPKITLYKFADVKFHPSSDAIRIGRKVYWEKSTRVQFTKSIPMDRDLLCYDREAQALLLKNYPRSQKVKSGFSLTGVHINSWGHFIGNFFPKMMALKEINDNNVVILLPGSVDAHIKGLVELCAERLGSYKVLYLDPELPVECETLYYCSSPSYLADHADYLHPTDIHISQYSIIALHELAKLVRPENSPTGNRKLFIGRTGARNLINYDEVEALFVKYGFDVVYPHLMPLSEKIDLFAQASHIAGPASSGFTNLIFSRPGTKLFNFMNFARSLDLYAGPFTQEPFCMKFYFVTGDEPHSSNIHNSYQISIDRIQAALAATNFLD